MTLTNIIFESVNGLNTVPIDDVFLRDRKLFLNDEVSADSCNDLIKKMMYLESQDNTKPVTLFCNSPGGSVTSGLALYDTMRLMKSPITVCVAGMAASMGAFLLSSGTKGKRYVLPNAEVMIHQPLGGAQGQATEIQIAAEHILKIKDKLNHILAKNTGQTLKKIIQDTDRDNFLDAKEAVAYGLVDKIVEKR